MMPPGMGDLRQRMSAERRLWARRLLLVAVVWGVVGLIIWRTA